MTTTIRQVVRIIEPQPVVEGAGVRLKRSIAGAALDYLDPFLLFDHFGSDNPRDYLPGFPMHPHRGIETVTYMLAGAVTHRDSLGNAGTHRRGRRAVDDRGPRHHARGDARAGGRPDGGLPALGEPARPAQDDEAALPGDPLRPPIPEVRRADGAVVRVIAGSVGDVRGPVTDIFAEPEYLDVTLPADASFEQPVTRGHNAFAYIFEGGGTFGDGTAALGSPKMVILGDGDIVRAHAGANGLRFLLVSGAPLGEPIARYGPFVMNTREEILQALADLRDGTFVQP